MTEQKIQAKRIKELEDQGYYVIKLLKTNKNATNTSSRLFNAFANQNPSWAIRFEGLQYL